MHYWEKNDINLHFESKKDCSVDENGAKNHKVKATVPEQFVTELQADLIALGYLDHTKVNKDGFFGGGLKRNVIRFQRHALRSFRMLADKTKVDLAPADQYTGPKDGVVNLAMANEIRRWILKGWVIPVGVVKLEKLADAETTLNPKMRVDAKTAWEAIVKRVTAAGGTLEGPYGDVFRGLTKPTSVGASLYSVHYCGRAVDINQGLTNKYINKKGDCTYFGKKR